MGTVEISHHSNVVVKMEKETAVSTLQVDLCENINMRVTLYCDGFVEREATMDYLKDGVTAVGNAIAEEMQFVTAFVVEG